MGVWTGRLVLILATASAAAAALPVPLPTLASRAAGSIPPSDPLPAGAAPQFESRRLTEHPRLVFSPADLPRLRAFYRSGEFPLWREKLQMQAQSAVVPTDRRFLTDDTEAQRQAFWRLPSVALEHVLTGDPAALVRAQDYLRLFLAQPDWELSFERNSGMGAANLLAGTALAYDWLYGELDSALREALRAKLWAQARAMYYGGHRQLNPPPHYWQQDAQNNHRWHADAGLALAVLGTYDGRPEQRWLLEQLRAELETVAAGLPADGSTHESGAYLAFGGAHLVLAFEAADRCLGTGLLGGPFFQHNAAFRLGLLGNGLVGDALDFGDWSGDGLGAYNAYLFALADRFHQSELRGLLRSWALQRPAAFPFGWMGLIWDSSPTGPAPEVPLEPARAGYWPDLGLAVVRSSSRPGGVALRFKCGPLGGTTLNRFQHQTPNGYVNVGHDDPDANSFVLSIGGKLVAETDRYSERKASSHHNTLLVNGVGQTDASGVENQEWMQPRVSVNDAAVRIVRADFGKAFTVLEGEAAAAYPALTTEPNHRSRPALERYRRTMVWVPDQYILIFDSVRAAAPADLEWLIQAPQLERAAGGGEGDYRLKAGETECPLLLRCDQPLRTELRSSPADDHGRLMGWRQLVATGHAAELHFVALLDPWGRRPRLRVAFGSAGTVRAEVELPQATRRWSYAPPEGGQAARVTEVAQ